MTFNEHYNLKGKHAFLSPSQPHWLRYPKEKLIKKWRGNKAKIVGTALHALACDCITLGVGVSDDKHTIGMYVRDALEFSMTPEQPLYYAPTCFGTADAISFKVEPYLDEQKMVLRIHDLKTGQIMANMDQLRIYAALYCLEYRVDPFDIVIILRIYQNDEIKEEVADPELISEYMIKIVESVKTIEEIESDI